MKKKIGVFLLISLLGVLIVGCSKKKELDEKDRTLYPVSTYEETLAITMGDVMPFYDDGVMNIYHLQNSKGTNSMYYHPISRVTTRDYIHYKDEGIVIPFEEEYNSPDAAIGTGSFIKDKNGKYHCFYTGHNAAEGTGLPRVEVVRHATSDDQKTWKKVEDFNLYGDCDDFRDPYVYYDSFDECYYMLITTRVNGTGVIKQYSATDLMVGHKDWKDCGVFFWNDNGSYNMECPSYIEYNGFYYLAFSEQGDNRVTHYRFKTSLEGDWKKFERDSIDASGFYAGRLEKAGDELYAFAWCANLTGGFTGDFDWGGNLVTHKITQSASGELNAVMIDNVYNHLSKEVEYKTLDNKKLDSLSFDKDGFHSTCIQKLSKNITRLNFKFTIEDRTGDFGLTFNVKGADNRLGSAVIAFEPSKNSLTCYNNVQNVIRYGSALSTVSFVYARNKEYEVNVLIDNEIMTVYLDDAVALTVRLTGASNKNFAFYSNQTGVTFRGIKFYE
ncbi:MAG: hypothetical protein NC087_06180 [Anaeroplasma bactoclasticum]|nr:hypothetical protein [Anaeroplasma bactoclasticum]